MELSLIFSVLGLILWAFSFLYLRAYVRKRTVAERILFELRREVEVLVSEVDAITDRDLALVEDRIKALRSILDEADKRIAAHNRELERGISQERAYRELGLKKTVASSAAVQESPESIRKNEAAAAGASIQNSIKPGLLFSEIPENEIKQDKKPEQSRLEQGKLPTQSNNDSGINNKTQTAPQSVHSRPRFIRSQEQIQAKPTSFSEKVVELSEAGFSPDLIAKRLGSTVSEVDLAIALHKRKDSLQ